jgi:dienelactone hydrolase
MRRIAIALAAIAVSLLASGWLLSTSAYGRTIGLLLRAAHVDGPGVARVARWQTSPVTETEHVLPTRRGELRARTYTPAVVRTRPVVLLGGVHALGIDEPRLRHLATELARSGTVVVTPELSDFTTYAITARVTDDIEDAALAVADRLGPGGPPDGDGRIGLIGVSFSGGLAVVAAGRPALRDRVAFVFSFGGHASLPRVLRYLATGRHPDGDVPPPHDYGGVVLLMNVAPDLVPEAQVGPLRHAVSRFLYASHLAMFDEARAAEVFAEAQALEAPLPDASRHLLHLVNSRNSGELGRTLLPHLQRRDYDPSLSPETSPPPAAPVFLLHAEHDTVIPTLELEALRSTLETRGTPVRALTTGLLAHAHVRRAPRLRELVELVRFWTEMPWE